MLVERVDPDDDEALGELTGVLRASDKDTWPELSGFDERDVTAYARFAGRTRRFEMLVARAAADGPVLGVALLELPMVDNLHSVEITLAVHPARRRLGVGTALIARVEELARAAGRHSVNGIVDVPVAQARDHPSIFFAPHVGFTSTLGGNSRRLDLPVAPAKMEALWGVVGAARDAADYRTLAWMAPWPAEYADDECELLRVMSTDEPAGDGEHEEEHWTPERVREYDELRRARGAAKFCAVAQHLPTGRLVAFSEILVCESEPRQSWQLVTVVHPEHRGHRLGLAVKLRNVEQLAERAPGIAFVVTGNAAVNAPMIAVNDMMGFVVQGDSRFWQKRIDRA